MGRECPASAARTMIRCVGFAHQTPCPIAEPTQSVGLWQSTGGVSGRGKRRNRVLWLLLGVGPVGVVPIRIVVLSIRAAARHRHQLLIGVLQRQRQRRSRAAQPRGHDFLSGVRFLIMGDFGQRTRRRAIGGHRFRGPVRRIVRRRLGPPDETRIVTQRTAERTVQRQGGLSIQVAHFRPHLEAVVHAACQNGVSGAHALFICRWFS